MIDETGTSQVKQFSVISETTLCPVCQNGIYLTFDNQLGLAVPASWKKEYDLDGKRPINITSVHISECPYCSAKLIAAMIATRYSRVERNEIPNVNYICNIGGDPSETIVNLKYILAKKYRGIVLVSKLTDEISSKIDTETNLHSFDSKWNKTNDLIFNDDASVLSQVPNMKAFTFNSTSSDKIIEFCKPGIFSGYANNSGWTLDSIQEKLDVINAAQNLKDTDYGSFVKTIITGIENQLDEYHMHVKQLIAPKRREMKKYERRLHELSREINGFDTDDDSDSNAMIVRNQEDSIAIRNQEAFMTVMTKLSQTLNAIAIREGAIQSPEDESEELKSKIELCKEQIECMNLSYKDADDVILVPIINSLNSLLQYETSTEASHMAKSLNLPAEILSHVIDTGSESISKEKYEILRDNFSKYKSIETLAADRDADEKMKIAINQRKKETIQFKKDLREAGKMIALIIAIIVATVLIGSYLT